MGVLLKLVEPYLSFKQSSEVVRFAHRKLPDCGLVIGLEGSEWRQSFPVPSDACKGVLLQGQSSEHRA